MVEVSLEDHQVVIVDEVHDPMLFGDAPPAPVSSRVSVTFGPYVPLLVEHEARDRMTRFISREGSDAR